MTLPRPPILALLLFILAVAVLLPGITSVTGITGKDEYLLGLRTPMHMIEGGHGWLPWLDGEPRLKKPPLIYWLGKASYETFGISLFSARIIGVFFAAMLTVVCGLIAWMLYRDRQNMLLAGLVVLGSIGVMVDGRRLMLDIPVAALSALAILFLLYWRKTGSAAYAAISGVVLGLAFLVKGPVALFFFIAGMLAMLLASPGSADFLRRKWPGAILLISCFAMVAVPWFVYIYMIYPEQLAQVLSAEVAERELFNISLSPLFSLLLMALPWSAVALAVMLRKPAAVIPRDDWIEHRKFLLLWLLLSILPFFFFRSFSRYLYGCMIPLAVITSMLVFEKDRLRNYRVWIRSGAILSLLIAAALVFLLLWFRGWQPVVVAPLLFMLAFAMCWWRAENLVSMSVMALLMWLGIVGMVYPALNINRIPSGLVEKVAGEYVVLFAGPQPAMLPIVAGVGMRDTSRLWSLPEDRRDSCKGILIFSPVKHFITARHQLQKLEHDWTELGRYRVLSSRGSWLRIAHEDATDEDWKRAFTDRDLDSLGTEIILVRSVARQCR